MKKIILIMLLFSFNAHSNSEFKKIEQPYLESILSCNNIQNKINLCFIKSIEHYDFKSFIFTFKIGLSIKESELKKTIMAATDQISLSLNPLTAEFYKEKSYLITELKNNKFKKEDIIIELKITNNHKKYTSYMYPKKNKNGNISLISSFSTGDIDTFKKMKENCSVVKSSSLSDRERIDESCRPYNSNINNESEEKNE